jgi:SNF2 family DNA or RNA helicase
MTFTIFSGSRVHSLLWLLYRVSCGGWDLCVIWILILLFLFRLSKAIPHWERAFRAWTDLNVIDYRGSNVARNLIVDTEFYYKDHDSNNIKDRWKFDVLITTYEMVCTWWKGPPRSTHPLLLLVFRPRQVLHCSARSTGNVVSLMKPIVWRTR